MALVLTLREKSDFFIGEERFVVSAVTDDKNFALRQDSTKKKFAISDKEVVEVMPDVFIQAGTNAPMVTARVVIDAPLSIKVLRGDKKRSTPEKVLSRSA